MAESISPNTKEPTTAELVEAAQGGDKEAFGELVKRYYALIFSLVYSILKIREAAEDMVQEVFTKAWEKLDQVKKPGSFQAWLVKIAARMARKKPRQRDKPGNGLVSLDHPDQHGLQILFPEQSPLDRVLQGERNKELWDALETLNERERLVLTLRYFGEMSYRQIGEELGITANNVGQIRLRALKKLRKELERNRNEQ